MGLMEVINGEQTLGGWLTGRSPEEEYLYADEVTADSCVKYLKDVATTTLTSAQTEINAALDALNSLPGVENAIPASCFTEAFTSIGETITGLATTLDQTVADIKAYGNADGWTKFTSTVGMVVAKPLEGLLSVVEDLGDGILSVGGFIAGGLGLEGAQNAIGDAIKANWSHDVFQYDKWAKYSAITEDSAIGNGLRIAGKVAGFVAGGHLAAGALGLSASATYGAGLLSASGSTIGGTVLAGVTGLGAGTAQGLNANMSFNDAFANGAKQGLGQAAFAFAAGAAADRISSLIGGSKAGTELAKSGDELTNGAKKAGTELAKSGDELTNGAKKAGTELAKSGDELTNGAKKAGTELAKSGDELTNGAKKAGTELAKSGDELTNGAKKAGTELAKSGDELTNGAKKAGTELAKSGDELTNGAKKAGTELAKSGDELTNGAKKAGTELAKSGDELTNGAKKAGTELAKSGDEVAGGGNAARDAASSIDETTSGTGNAARDAASSIDETTSGTGNATRDAASSLDETATTTKKAAEAVDHLDETVDGTKEGVQEARQAAAAEQPVVEGTKTTWRESAKAAITKPFRYVAENGGLKGIAANGTAITASGVVTGGVTAEVSERYANNPPIDARLTNSVPDPNPNPDLTQFTGPTITSNAGTTAAEQPAGDYYGGGSQDAGGYTGGGGGGGSTGGGGGGGGSYSPYSTAAPTTAQPTISTKPSSTPTSKPGSTPTSKPGSTPTSKPGSTPTSKPGSTPTSKPGSTPTSKPGSTPGYQQDETHTGVEYDGTGSGQTGESTAASLADLLDDDSSIDDIIKGSKYSRIPTSSKPISAGNNGSNSVIPIAAGLTVASAAGLGAKAYLDRKRAEEEDEDEDEEYEDENAEDDLVVDGWEESNGENYDGESDFINIDKQDDDEYYRASENPVPIMGSEELEEF